MFFLKQLCAHVEAKIEKKLVAQQVIPDVVDEVRRIGEASREREIPPEEMDCVANAILLLLALSVWPGGLVAMLSAGALKIVQGLLDTHLGSIESLEVRLDQLDMRL